MAVADLLDSLPDLAEEPVEEVVGYRLSVNRGTRLTGIRIIRTAAAVAAVILVAWGIKQFFPQPLTKEPASTNLLTNTQHPTPDTRNLIPDTRYPTPNTQHPPTDNRQPTTDNPSAKSPVLPDTVLYAAAFVPNPVYESLTAAKYRSGSDPHVAGPDNRKNIQSGDTIRFSWTPDPADSYRLIVLDNRASVVKEIQAGSGSALAWKADLTPGLYYWKFVGKDEMWKVGVFRVMRGR
jgi:hypothetical protein